MNEENEKIQPTEQAKKFIADASAEFLRTRMQITQEILSCNNTETITLDNYINGLSKLENDRQASIEYSKNNMGRIAFSNDEIEELVSLVKQSLTKYSIGDVSFSGPFTSLVKDAISNLEKNIKKDKTLTSEEVSSKLNLIKKWKNIAYGNYSFCIDPRISGRITWGYFDEFTISDSKSNLVCKIGLDGTDKMISENIQRKEEDVLIANKLFTSMVHTQDEQYFTILLLDENNKKAKEIGNNKTYPLVKQNNNEEYADLGMPFNMFLELNGLSYLTDDLYDEFTLERNKKVYNKSINLTVEETKQIEKVVSCAVDWWANAISNPKFDNGDLMASLMASLLNNESPKPQNEKIEKFKEYLGNEIRAGILTQPQGFRLSVDYDPDIYLYNAATKAKLDTGISNFPWKTTMIITTDKVVVRAGYGASEEIIYDVNEDILTSDETTSKKTK